MYSSNKPPGWNEFHHPARMISVPEDLIELADWFALEVERFRLYPEKDKHYFRTKQSGGGAIAFATTSPNPRHERARLMVAYRAIQNVHRWLEHNGITGQPLFAKATDDVDEVEQQMSLLLNWLREVSKSKKKRQEPISDDLVTIKQIAKLVFLGENSISSQKKDWPEPKIKHAGRRPAKYSYRQILPKLKEQFPDISFPDRSPSKSQFTDILLRLSRFLLRSLRL